MRLYLLIILASILILLVGYVSFDNSSNIGDNSKSSTSKVQSNLDGHYYQVKDLDSKEDAADILAEIQRRCNLLVEYFKNNESQYPEYKQYIDLFLSRINGVKIIENPNNDNSTSYTINKGEVIAFCLRSKKTNNFHTINMIMYVALHEFSHVACPTLNHGPPFPQIFRFFLKCAEKIGIYQHVNYQINPHEYCGITIRENIK